MAQWTVSTMTERLVEVVKEEMEIDLLNDPAETLANFSLDELVKALKERIVRDTFRKPSSHKPDRVRKAATKVEDPDLLNA
jgi:hypothetical protein